MGNLNIFYTVNWKGLEFDECICQGKRGIRKKSNRRNEGIERNLADVNMHACPGFRAAVCDFFVLLRLAHDKIVYQIMIISRS